MDAAVVVISHGYWQRNFAMDSAVVGKTLVLNGRSLTIVGVCSPEFYGLEPGSPVDVLIPLALQPSVLPEFGNRLATRDGWWSLWQMGRLKPGVSNAQARAELDVLLRQWLTENKTPEAAIQRSFARVELESASKGLDALRRQFSRPLLVLSGAVGLVLLIACGNIANLLLARSAQRRKEMAVRMAIGASRLRLMRQLLTEGIVLAGIGGMAGVLFGWWGSHLLVAFISSGPARINLDVHPDVRVLAFTSFASLLTGILVSLVPALRGTRMDLTPALKQTTASFGCSTSRLGWKFLVAGQVSLSLCLVIGASLFAFSLRNITTLGAGFRVENLLFVSFDTLGTGFDRERLKTFFHDALERVRSLPGVRAGSLSSLAPLSSDDWTWSMIVPGFVAASPDDQAVHINQVSPGYFETMGIPLLAGREFTSQDNANAPQVAVINETLKRFYFAETDPVGKTVQIGRDPAAPRIEIVGVVKDSQREDLRAAPERTVYLLSLQQNGLAMTLEVRTAAAPASVLGTIRQAMLEVSRDVPIREIKTAQAQLDGGLVQERLVAILSSFFGALALLLAAVGLYGTLSHLVTRRTSEIGIRMALGARRADVVQLVMAEAVWPVLIGIGLGLLAALAAGRVVAGMLFGLSASNPVALSLSIVILLAAAGMAAFLPVRRATRVEPLVALRYE